MRTYDEALVYSKKNPTEVVEFNDYSNSINEWLSGSFLNGKKEGMFEYRRDNVLKIRDVHNSKTGQSEHIYFWSDNSIRSHYFSKDDIIYGEYKYFNEDGVAIKHKFYKSSTHVEELDYLVNELRDDTFYVTLALYGIDKEYTFQ